MYVCRWWFVCGYVCVCGVGCWLCVCMCVFGCVCGLRVGGWVVYGCFSVVVCVYVYVVI